MVAGFSVLLLAYGLWQSGDPAISIPSVSLAVPEAATGPLPDSLAAAAQSLAAGSGPSGGSPMACQSGAGGTLGCQAPHAQGDPPALGFQRSSVSTLSPPANAQASLAWDFALGEAVYFGGSDGAGAGQTWTFAGGIWTNRSAATPEPAARWGASMAYDNQSGIQAVVLFGGCGVVCPMSDTWLFSGSGWTELSSSAPSPGVLFEAPMSTWGQSGTLLYGGCLRADCDVRSSATWAFESNTTCQSLYAAPCWVNLTKTLSLTHSPPALAGAALADDPLVGPVQGTVVLYGGFYTLGASSIRQDTNATWLFDGTSWTNATSSYSGASYPNEGRSLASLFWDPITQRLYLWGGWNDDTSTAFVSAYATDVDAWFTFAPSASPNAAYGMSSTSGEVNGTGTTIPALVVGGNSTAGVPENSTWVFELSIVNSVNVLPSVAKANTSVSFFSNATGGDRPASAWTFGDGSGVPTGNATHVYTIPATYHAKLTSTDHWGAQNVTTVTVVIVPSGLSVRAPSILDVGVAGTFSAVSYNGTPPFNFTWTFSDGSLSYGGTVNHTFYVVGPASATVTVRDAVGTNTSGHVSLTIAPTLSGGGSLSPRPVDIGSPVLLVANGSGGAPPYIYNWSLPNGRSLQGSNLTYIPTSVGASSFGLTVLDRGGGRWSTSLPLEVNPALTFNATASSTSYFSGRHVDFSATVSGGTPPYTYTWLFGDGGSSNVPAPSHTYKSSGTFLVNVWINDSGEGHYHRLIDAKVARVSGGLIWQIGDLPWWEQVSLGVAAVVAVGVLVGLVVRRSRRSRRPPPTGPAGRVHAMGGFGSR
jgi:hypothetical protein